MEEETELTPDAVCIRAEPGPYGLDRSWYTLTRAAAELGTSRHGLHHAATRGRIKAHKLGQKWYIPRAEVVRLMERRPVDPHPNDSRHLDTGR